MNISGKKTILLVEDEAIVALAEKAQLQKYGYNVHHVSTGEKAVQTIAENTPPIDLILMDIDLGDGINGTQAAEIILKDHDIPLVFLSSHTEPEIVEKTEQITSYGYVVKNSSVTVIDASIKMAFRLFDLNRKLKDELIERKRIDAALQESEVKFRALFENGPIGVAYHEMVYNDSGKAIDYRFLDANESYLKLTGVDPRGKLVTEAFPGIEDDPFDWIGTFGHVAKTGEEIRFEQYLQLNDRWYDCVGYQVKPDHFVAAFMEITERKKVERAVANALANHRILLDNIPTQIWYLTGPTMYGAVNEAHAQFAGVRKEDLAFKDIKENFPDEVVAQCRVSNSEVFRTRKTVVSHEWAPDASGEMRLLSITKTPKLNEKGDVEYVVCAAEDITDHKQALDALRKSNQTAERFLNIAAEIIIGLDTDGNITLLNESGHRLLGWEPGALIGKNWFDTCIPTEIQQEIKRVFSMMMAGDLEPVMTYENEVVTRSGATLTVFWHNAILFDDEGIITGVLTSGEDITERKKIETELQHQKDLLQNITDNMFDLVSVVNVDGTYKHAGNALKNLGYDPRSLLGTNAFEIVHPDDITRVAASLTELIKSNKMKHNEDFRIRCADGSYIWFETAAKKIFGENGEIRELLLSSRDISQRRQAENEVQRQLAEKETLLKEVHHRIKNNIAQVESLLSLQTESSSNPEVQAALREAISRVQSMRVLYDKLLIGKDHQDTSVKDYIESLVDSLIAVFPEREKILIEKNIADFTVSSKKLIPVGIIINELLTNVFKYSFPERDGGHALIELYRTETHATLIIQDNGVGLDDRATANKSTGFGLIIVQMLVEQLGGTYSVETGNGNGRRSVLQFEI